MPTDAEVDAKLYANFQTAVASVAAAPYRVYWLGESIEQPGGVSLKASVGGIAYEASSERLNYRYGARHEAGIEVEIFSREAWGAVRADRLRRTGGLDTLETKSAVVAAHPAEVWVVSGASKRVSNLSVIVDIGETIVVCSTASMPQPDPNAGPPVPLDTYIARMKTPTATPLPDLNPLIDEQTFLPVLQNLRPYPQ